MESYSTEQSWAVYTHPESDSVWIAENDMKYEDPCVMCVADNLTIIEARARKAEIELQWEVKARTGKGQQAEEREWAVYIRPEDNKIWIDADSEVCPDPLGYRYIGNLTIEEARETRDRLKKIRRI